MVILTMMACEGVTHKLLKIKQNKNLFSQKEHKDYNL